MDKKKEKKLSKVMKFKIYSKDKEIYKLLHELCFETRKVLNKTINFMYEWSEFSLIHKEKFDLYPKASEVLENKLKGGFYKTETGYIDKLLGDKFYFNSKSNKSCAIQRASKLWKDYYKDILKGIKTVPFYKSSNKIYLHSNSIKTYQEKNNYYIDLTLFSQDYKKELELTSCQHTFHIVIGDNTQRQIFNRILNNEYEIGGSQLVYDKKNKKFFIMLTYQFEPKENKGINILGIDMGIKYPVYMAIHDSLIRGKINGGEIEQFRRQMKKRRLNIRKQRVVCGNGSKSRGRNNFLKPVTKLGNKESNFRALTNHRYSRYIIDFAVKHNCKIICMENLSGISKENTFLKNWTYFDLQQKIEYKAKELGIEIIYVEPSYTSQTCSKCGHVDKENRQDQKTFICTKCGFEENADYNASLNIANLDFGNLKTVKKARKDKEKKDKLKLKSNKKEILTKGNNKTKESIDNNKKLHDNNYNQITISDFDNLINM
jgi:IS605 OrfB family transposase